MLSDRSMGDAYRYVILHFQGVLQITNIFNMSYLQFLLLLPHPIHPVNLGFFFAGFLVKDIPDNEVTTYTKQVNREEVEWIINKCLIQQFHSYFLVFGVYSQPVNVNNIPTEVKYYHRKANQQCGQKRTCCDKTPKKGIFLLLFGPYAIPVREIDQHDQEKYIHYKLFINAVTLSITWLICSPLKPWWQASNIPPRITLSLSG